MIAPKKQRLSPMMGTSATNLIVGWLEKRKEENARQVVAVVRNITPDVQIIPMRSGIKERRGIERLRNEMKRRTRMSIKVMTAVR